MIAQYTLELRNGLPSLVTEKIHYISEKGYINSETVIQLLNDTLRLNRKAEEHVVMLALNTALDIIGIFPISHGSLNESHCRGREIFQRAFLVGANGMILAHNHPSGHLEPSKEDLARKEELQQLGKLSFRPLTGISLFLSDRQNTGRNGLRFSSPHGDFSFSMTIFSISRNLICIGFRPLTGISLFL